MSLSFSGSPRYKKGGGMILQFGGIWSPCSLGDGQTYSWSRRYRIGESSRLSWERRPWKARTGCVLEVHLCVCKMKAWSARGNLFFMSLFACARIGGPIGDHPEMLRLMKLTDLQAWYQRRHWKELLALGVASMLEGIGTAGRRTVDCLTLGGLWEPWWGERIWLAGCEYLKGMQD